MSVSSLHEGFYHTDSYWSNLSRILLQLQNLEDLRFVDMPEEWVPCRLNLEVAAFVETPPAQLL